LRNAPEPVRFVILEASAILEIDFTAAQVLRDLIRRQKEHIVLAIAQLESIRFAIPRSLAAAPNERNEFVWDKAIFL
jgi:hypothetical protein